MQHMYYYINVQRKGGEEMHNTNVEIIVNLIVIILRNNQVDEKVIEKIIKAVYPNING